MMSNMAVVLILGQINASILALGIRENVQVMEHALTQMEANMREISKIISKKGAEFSHSKMEVHMLVSGGMTSRMEKERLPGPMETNLMGSGTKAKVRQARLSKQTAQLERLHENHLVCIENILVTNHNVSSILV